MSNEFAQRAEDAYAQLMRYGGAPMESIVEMMEALSDINDDLHNGMDYTQCLKPNIDKLRGMLERLDARRRTNAIEELEATMVREGRNPRPAPTSLREALIEATAHLAAAASAYSVYACRHSSQGRPVPDALFSTRVKDFNYAAARARTALVNPALQEPKKPDPNALVEAVIPDAPACLPVDDKELSDELQRLLPVFYGDPEGPADADRWRFAMDWDNKDFAVCKRQDMSWTPIKTSGPLDLARMQENPRNHPFDYMMSAMLKTMASLGYKWSGGKLWKPPLGSPPWYITPMEPLSDKDLTQLMQFYKVGALPELVTQQSHHIEKLQGKLQALQPSEDATPPPVREG